jgi:hypothetical protein
VNGLSVHPDIPLAALKSSHFVGIDELGMQRCLSISRDADPDEVADLDALFESTRKAQGLPLLGGAKGGKVRYLMTVADD